MATKKPKKAPLSKELMVETAVALADADGFEAASMRNIADALGTAPMSLYRHCANKERLIDRMVDVVFGEMYPPAIGGDWITELRKRAVSAACGPPRPPVGGGLDGEPHGARPQQR